MTGALANHLWQSTVFVVVAWLLTMVLRRSEARVRHALWLAASAKFLVPFALFVALGSQLDWAPTGRPLAPPAVSAALSRVGEPFSAPLPIEAPTSIESPGQVDPLQLAVLAIWAGGALLVACVRFRLWRRVRTMVRTGRPYLAPRLPAGIDVRSVRHLMEPGVAGIWHPVLLVPEGIEDHLTPRQLDAVLVHEQCHIRRRDNLTATFHMGVEAVFWFHPLVWWIGVRLVQERERACDEDVLRRGGDPHDYVEGILSVCRRYVEAPLACVAGVGGADLRTRVESILRFDTGRRLNAAQRVALGLAAIVPLAVPITIGASQAGPPSTEERPRFEVASVRRNMEGSGLIGGDCRGVDSAMNGSGVIAGLAAAAGGRPTAPGRCRFVRSTLRELIIYAYDIPPRNAAWALTGGPGWMDADRFDFEATSQTLVGVAEMKLMLQVALEERFSLRVRRDVAETSGYALTVATGGPRVERATDADAPERWSGGLVGGTLTASNTSTARLAGVLSTRLGRPVEDRTGLTGAYDLSLSWTPGDGEASPFGGRLPPEILEKLQSPADPLGPSLFTALEEQLGLRLIPQPVSSERLIVERAERPSEN